MHTRRMGEARRTASVPLRKTGIPREVCFELEDNSTERYPASEFFPVGDFRSSLSAARLAEQFETQNRQLFTLFDVQVDHLLDGNDVVLRFQAGNKVGAVPLFSPSSGAADYGLIVKPRFPWSGLGPMLAQMGWRIAPTPLRLPLLRRSERRVPLWVLSLMILGRLKALLDSMSRRFEIVDEIRNAPRGLVDWAAYANRYVSKGQFTQIPCTYPDLRDDRLLKGAIRHSLEHHLRALQTQREHGSFVHSLISLYEETLRRVRDVKAYEPSSSMLASWLQRPLRAQHFADGIQAIEWTIEQRGLAGSSDLEGIPWLMPMEQFFEAWVETVLQVVARNTGAQIKVGRRRETTRPISWEPPYVGSQKSLIPDIWLEWESTTLIVDAKYKRHWEELQRGSWFESAEELKEEHRTDLLQVLAYGNLARSSRVVACLIYPCSAENWVYLHDRGRLVHKAEIAAGSRSLHVWLTAIPMATSVENITPPLVRELRTLIEAA